MAAVAAVAAVVAVVALVPEAAVAAVVAVSVQWLHAPDQHSHPLSCHFTMLVQL